MRWLRVAALGALAGLPLLAGCSSSPAEVDTEPADRVLIVSLPGVGWDDLGRHDLPNLEAFVEDAAIGDMSTRIGRRNATATDAYLTIGSGTRAVAPSEDVAVAVDPGDQYGGVPTAEILRRRLGYVPDGIAYLASGAARDANESSAFGADVGLLGDTLAAAGVDRGVVANADSVEGFVTEDRPPDGYYARSAATALMGGDGIVPDGTVGRSLLVDDPDAAFGRRMDHHAVLDAFAQVWDRGSRTVALVEASDIARAAAYRGRSSPSQGSDLHEQALTRADELLGELLARTDPDRDAVLVLSPVSRSATPELGIAALRAPDVEPAMLQSPTTRRDGYVHLADVAPTVTSLLGEEYPTDVEGRSFQVSGAAGDDRVDRLVDSSDAAAFRDAFLPTVVTAIVVILALLTAATVARHRLPHWVRPVTVAVALGVLGAVPGMFLVGQVSLAHDSTLGHTAVIAGTGALVAAGALLIERRRRGMGVLVAVAAPTALIVADVLSGAHLQMNTIFGYSMAVAGRYTGLGNLAYALFGASAVVVAALVVERYGPRALGVVAALLAGVVLVDGLPMLGADVGGVVSLIPAFGVTVLLLAGRRVGWREAAGLAVLAVGTVLVLAFVDAARPEQTHTHLARYAELVLDGEWQPFFSTLNRRWQASFGSLPLAGWATVVTALATALIYALAQERRRAGRRLLPRALAPAAEQHAPTAAMLSGLVVLGAIGLVVNDSSVAVPFTMFIVAVPVFVVRTIMQQQPAIELARAGRGGPGAPARR